MTKKQYDSIQYVAQEFRKSLARLIQKTSGGEITITHSYNPNTNESIISYSIFQLQVELIFQKEKGGLYLTQKNKHKTLEEKTTEKLKLKRSKTRRLSQNNIDNLTKKSLLNLKEFYQKNTQ